MGGIAEKARKKGIIPEWPDASIPDTGKTNRDFIDGTWYDSEYANPEGRYHKTYFNNPHPEHVRYADQTNKVYVDLAIALTSISKGARVLDLGSGIGKFMEAWYRSGFNVWGIELSQVAHKFAKHPTMVNGSVADMSMFRDNEFDMVFSSAFWEHIDESILDQSLAECKRVGTGLHFHLIATERGNDPSHINLKPMLAWKERMQKEIGGFWFLVPDVLMNEYPMLIGFPDERYLTYPLLKYTREFEGGMFK